MTVPPSLQASKWLKVQLLIESNEMRNLFEALEGFFIYITSGVVKEGEGQISHETFLACYAQYINHLKRGQLLDQSIFGTVFSSVFTTSRSSIHEMSVGKNLHLMRVIRPVIQLQHHRMDYSSFDGKFRPMVFGTDSIYWGIQFSYPQIFQDPETKQVMNVNEEFPNTALFKKLQKWMRHATIPTPFIVGEVKTNVPMRLGRECLSWINDHPQFKAKGLKVKV